MSVSNLKLSVHNSTGPAVYNNVVMLGQEGGYVGEIDLQFCTFPDNFEEGVTFYSNMTNSDGILLRLNMVPDAHVHIWSTLAVNAAQIELVWPTNP